MNFSVWTASDSFIFVLVCLVLAFVCIFVGVVVCTSSRPPAIWHPMSSSVTVLVDVGICVTSPITFLIFGVYFCPSLIPLEKIHLHPVVICSDPY